VSSLKVGLKEEAACWFAIFRARGHADAGGGGGGGRFFEQDEWGEIKGARNSLAPLDEKNLSFGAQSHPPSLSSLKLRCPKGGHATSATLPASTASTHDQPSKITGQKRPEANTDFSLIYRCACLTSSFSSFAAGILPQAPLLLAGHGPLAGGLHALLVNVQTRTPTERGS